VESTPAPASSSEDKASSKADAAQAADVADVKKEKEAEASPAKKEAEASPAKKDAGDSSAKAEGEFLFDGKPVVQFKAQDRQWLEIKFKDGTEVAAEHSVCKDLIAKWQFEVYAFEEADFRPSSGQHLPMVLHLAVAKGSAAPKEFACWKSRPSTPPPKPQPPSQFKAITFAEVVDVADVKKQCQAEGRPALVIVTKDSSQCVKSLAFELNEKKEFCTKLQEQFILVNPKDDEGAQWEWKEEESQSVIPRCYFIDKAGEMIDIRDESAQKKGYERFAQNMKGLDALLEAYEKQLGE